MAEMHPPCEMADRDASPGVRGADLAGVTDLTPVLRRSVLVAQLRRRARAVNTHLDLRYLLNRAADQIELDGKE